MPPNITRSNALNATLLAVWACLGLVFVSGCTDRQWQEISAPVIEIPSANVPRPLRWENWRDANGSGSCVIASSCSVWEWSNRPELAERFSKAYAGGQTEKSIKDKWRENGISFVAPDKDHEYGDPEYLEWASKTRRAAIIWFFPNHCVTFVGFSEWQGKEVAWLLDNNRVGQFIPIEKKSFISQWRGFGGFCAIPLLTPAPSLPFQGFEVVQ